MDKHRGYHTPRGGPVGGFTLIEILIVVVILGILAAIVVPQFTSATRQSRISALKANLHRVRQQLQVYKQEHAHWPANNAKGDFSEQMTGKTKADGTPATEESAGVLGPYLQVIPANPMNDKNTISDDKAAQSGWYYDSGTGEFLANDSEASHKY